MAVCIPASRVSPEQSAALRRALRERLAAAAARCSADRVLIRDLAASDLAGPSPGGGAVYGYVALAPTPPIETITFSPGGGQPPILYPLAHSNESPFGYFDPPLVWGSGEIMEVAAAPAGAAAEQFGLLGYTVEPEGRLLMPFAERLRRRAAADQQALALLAQVLGQRRAKRLAAGRLRIRSRTWPRLCYTVDAVGGGVLVEIGREDGPLPAKLRAARRLMNPGQRRVWLCVHADDVLPVGDRLLTLYLGCQGNEAELWKQGHATAA